MRAPNTRQRLLQEGAVRLARLAGALEILLDELLDLLERLAEKAEALDHLHTLQCLFAKQAVIAFTAPHSAEESEVLVFAQCLDGHAAALGELPNRHRVRS